MKKLQKEVTIKPNSEWARKWKKRHPRIQMRIPTTLELSRVRASTQENLRPFFATLFALLLTNLYLPADIYNFDETSLQADPSPKRKVTCTKGSKVAYTPDMPLLFSSTAAFCISASGKSLQSCLILKKDFDPDLLEDFDDESTTIFTSANGWMTKRIFKYHLFKNIIPKIEKRLMKQFFFFL
jgi:hypothetical protein